MDVKTVISRYAQYYGDKTAVIYGDHKLSYKELNERSVRLANGLIRLGVKKDDRVGTIMSNCPQFIEGMFAKHKLGAVDVILSPRLSTTELEYQINDSELNTLLVAEEYISKIPERSKISRVKNFVITANPPHEGWLDYEKLLAGADNCEPDITVDNQELGHIVYTSGTTGKPKGIMWCRDSYLLTARNILLDALPGLNSQDVFLGRTLFLYYSLRHIHNSGH